MTAFRKARKLIIDLYHVRLIVMQRNEPTTRWLARAPGFMVSGFMSALLLLHSFSLGMAMIVTSWAVLALVAAHEEFIVTRYDLTGEDDEPVL